MAPKLKAKLLDKLIASLERAETASRELDMFIALALAQGAAEGAPSEGGEILQVLVEEGYPWELVTELLSEELPAYTATLASTIPGENVVMTLKSEKRGRWAALHRDEAGKLITAWAANECLARRAAGLKGLRARLLAETAESPPCPATPPRPPFEATAADKVRGPARPAAHDSVRRFPKVAKPVSAAAERDENPIDSDALLQRILRRSAPLAEEPTDERVEAEPEREWKILF